SEPASLRQSAVELAQHALARALLDRRREQDRLSRLPVVSREVVGDAADDVGRAVPQVRAAAAVEVDGEIPVASRHELRNAERSGERALRGERGQPELAREKQELLELAAEKRRPARIVERERGQHIEGPVAAHVSAVEGLDAEDR